MMMRQSVIAALLISAWVQSLTMVTAFEGDDAAAFTEPMSKLTDPTSTVNKLIPGGGTNGLVGGLVPDTASLVKGGGGLASKREEGATDTAESGSGLAMSSGNQQSGGDQESVTPGLAMLGLKKRMGGHYTSPELGKRSGGHILKLRRRKQRGDTSQSAGSNLSTTVSGLVDNAITGVLRRSISKLSGAEQMARAREGVVMDSQDKSGALANVRRRMVNNVVSNIKDKVRFGAGNQNDKR